MEARSSSLSIADMNVITARDSVRQIRRLSEDSEYENTVYRDRLWRLSYLKSQFESLDLGHLFRRYTERINHGYFSLFLILLTVLNIVHFSVILAANMENGTVNTVILDLAVYGVVSVLSMIGLFITDNYVKRKPRLLTLVSIMAFIALFMANFYLPVHHSIQDSQQNLRPAYTTLLVLACYVFFNVTRTSVAFVLGLFTTIIHVIAIIIITYKESNLILKRTASDIIYFICINGLGIYFRFINEIVKRKGFLDRRACVESTLKLKYEKQQEEQLMLSIIPKHIIEEVRHDIFTTITHFEKTEKLPRQKPFDNPYINVHENVTILYADIVNYTEMTTKLKPATKLVETLNDLFGRFDEASEELKVLRIKFLGDCYYCVAGLPPDSITNHADACVQLGLKMIQIIREVREQRNLSIDMRIGVHTGKILSGLIGLMKWQFDIWSKDVDIANRMETRGCAGKVHITKQTKDLLKKQYDITSSPEGQIDPLLRQQNIETYLITPPDVQYDQLIVQSNGTPKKLLNVEEMLRSPLFRFENNNEIFPISEISNSPDINEQPELSSNGVNQTSERRDTIYLRRPSGNPNLGNFDRRMSGNPNLTALRNQRRSGGSITVERIRERRNTPGEVQRRTAFMDNNINRYHERLRKTDISMRKAIETMPLSKYEQWFKSEGIHPFLLIFRNLNTELKFIRTADPLFKYYLLSAMLVLICISLIQNLTLPEWNWSAWLSYGAFGFIGLILLPAAWMRYLWMKYVDYFGLEARDPSNRFLRFLCHLSELISNRVEIRIAIYIISFIIFVACVFSELLECNSRYTRNRFWVYFASFAFRSTNTSHECVLPWHMSQSCALVVLMNFCFLRIHMWIKTVLAFSVAVFYALCVWYFNDGFYEDSETINYMVAPRAAHIIIIMFLAMALHLIDRQADYMNRLDYQWTEQLNEEKTETNTMHRINCILLNNILPYHVVDLYLNVTRQSKGLYHESYKNVAVMFASVVDYNTEGMNDSGLLKIMNQIIGDFDKLLNRTEGQKIEKIKVAKWTYMAACGLDPGRRNTLEDLNSDAENDDVVLSLLSFAVDMIKALELINQENFQKIKLRIGIAHGELTAGVIGSKKPLYDIWGNPVNMASRMDSTGIPGKIQIPDSTATIIQRHKISCTFRDNINVKGIKDPVPTYFVSLDNNKCLIRE